MHKKSTINQREVGVDVTSFAEAIRRALRQDPDIILVGELRDLETIEAAITAAETGHMSLGHYTPPVLLVRLTALLTSSQPINRNRFAPN